MSDKTRFLQGRVSAVLVDRLDRLAAQGEADPAAQLWNPDALGLKVRGNGALHHLGDVTTDTALFLGQTRTVDFAAGADAGSSDAANTGHNKKFRGCGTRRMAAERDPSRRILPIPA